MLLANFYRKIAYVIPNHLSYNLENHNHTTSLSVCEKDLFSNIPAESTSYPEYIKKSQK